MRKKVSISFLIYFYVMGAVAMFTGAAHAESSVTGFSGGWTCATLSSDGTTADAGLNTSRHMLYMDGTISGTTSVDHWRGEPLADHTMNWAAMTVEGTAEEGAYWVRMQYNLKKYHINESYDYLCLGSSFDAQQIPYEMDCTIGVLVGTTTMHPGTIVMQRAHCQRLDQQIK
ncbi:MAG: hypothetical protein HN366_09050 [Deltaproteobacteria bacterium]|jgi:subtilase family serine protease|nr:hypothetical protein [Deltaproteobacteria bacterium]